MLNSCLFSWSVMSMCLPLFPYPFIEKPKKADGEVIQSIQGPLTRERGRAIPQVSKQVRQLKRKKKKVIAKCSKESD